MKTLTFILSLCFCLLTTTHAMAADKEYIISKGDTLTIGVWGEPELSVSAVVRPDGKISLATIGDMKVAGMTTRALAARITTALSELLFNPQVYVAVNNFPSNNMLVYGPGTASSVIPLNGKTTLLQILSLINPGFTADLTNSYLEREGKKIATNFDDLYRKGFGEQANLEVLASDKLFIPLKPNLIVYIEGAVNNPTSLVLTEGLTILQAIHQAGGFSKFADPNDTVVTRNNERIVVRLSDLIDDGDMTQNILLQGGDLVVVDTSWF